MSATADGAALAGSPLSAAAERPTGLPTSALAGAALWLAVFLGGFVFREPAPYELFLAAIIPAWLIANPVLPRPIAPLIFLMALFCAGGIIAGAQAEPVVAEYQMMYYAVTGFLALSAIFFAAVIGSKPRLGGLVVNAWIMAALATVALGILGYVGLTGELFTRYGRAAGGFEDPNVFGPFLVFPLVVLIRRALTRSLAASLFSGALALFLVIGVFLSFSRAAWGLTVFCTLFMGGILFLTERSAAARARYIALGGAGLVCAILVIAVVLSIPAVHDLFQERAQLVQSYDAGRYGRFQRYGIGFNLMLEHPLGIGAKRFGYMYGEDEHNIWLKALTTYGWLGFIAYVTLVLWTLAAAFPLLFRTSPLQALVQAAYIVFVGHLAIATVIDIDHWRHVYLLFGLLWGAITADRLARQHRLAAYRAAQPPPSSAVSPQPA